jgi:hypothetical protein
MTPDQLDILAEFPFHIFRGDLGFILDYAGLYRQVKNIEPRLGPALDIEQIDNIMSNDAVVASRRTPGLG